MKPPLFYSARGERPSRASADADVAASAIAADLTPWQRNRFLELPIDDFPRPDWLKAKILDSWIRRGWIERCGYHRDGAWYYRLSLRGLGIQAALGAKRAP